MRAKTAKKTLSKVIEDYTNISEEFDRTRQYDWREFEMVLPYLKEKDTLVDLGCGNGRLINTLKSSGKINYIGIDNNKKLLEKAKLNHPQNKFIHGDLTKIPLESNSVDTVTVIASFHHLPSKSLRHQSLQEIRRILKHNGTLFLTVWNLFQPKYKKYIWHSYLRWLLSFGNYDRRDTFIPWGKSGIKRYYYAFKPQELEKMLEENGFQIIDQQQGNNLAYLCRKK